MAEASNEQSNLSEEDPIKLCDPCTFRRVQKQAGAYCQVCSEYLCDYCADLHRSFKATRGHELESLDESSTLTVEQRALASTIMACQNHSSETYTDFCASHDLLICRLCKLITHKKCDLKPLPHAAGGKNTKADIVESLEKTKVLVNGFQNIKELREHDKAKIQRSSTTIRKEIRTIKEELIAWAEQLEKSMLVKLEEKEQTLIDEISTHVRISEEMVKLLTKVITSFETLGQDVPVASLALLKKVKLQISEGQKANDEIMKEMKCQTMQFQKSTKLTSVMTELSEMGKIFTSLEKSDFLEFPSLQIMQKIKVDKVGGVTGCTFLPNDELVICDDSNRTVKVFTPDFILKNELQYGTRVWDVAAVSNEEVIVTETDSKVLQFLDVSVDIKKTKSIPVQQKCWGVDFTNDLIYTTCHPEYSPGGDVKVLKRDGSVVQTIKLYQGNPHYLSVNSTGKKIVVCTHTASTVLCFESSGTLLYTYSDRQLNSSLGVLFDSYDNLLICGQTSNNIHVVKSDGSKLKIILDSVQKIASPHCLAYCPSHKTLVVGQCGTSDSLLIFSHK